MQVTTPVYYFPQTIAYFKDFMFWRPMQESKINSDLDRLKQNLHHLFFQSFYPGLFPRVLLINISYKQFIS